eukprot:CAMPEP_0171104386 /NCGR_PEP_ID=MMETSP0766_2-20121228/60532_1 /TAXON_ID=439317 /ORGANISM="Gambierdiscus australes, Strain CAWD 149" /LENGTH=135 /DNA_ID=CAMNT_0011565005 /DNA_START=64 /DNA_END=467 /DNA_ORIENTATION=+
MAPRTAVALALATLVVLSAPTTFALWASRSTAADSAALRGAVQSRVEAMGQPEEASEAFSGVSACAVAAALGLAVALSSTPAVAADAAPAPAIKADKEVRTVLTKEQRLAEQKAKIQAEMAKLSLVKPDGTLKNG